MAAAAATTFATSYRRILVASADSAFRKQLIEKSGPRAVSEEATGGAHALAKLAGMSCEEVLLDSHLPDLDPREVAAIIRQKYPRIEVEIVDSKADARVASGTVEAANAESLRNDGNSSARVGLAPDEMPPAATRGTSVEMLPGMLGVSVAMKQVQQLARMVAARDTTVLITGETGTGKELVAQAIHKLSRRSQQPFVVVNCAAIPEALFESELFGYSRGAFTGAVQSRLGRVHVAQGGTLFLDEVGELPLSMQAKLLRFLQNGEVQRLGSSEVYRLDVRVVGATNIALQDSVRAKMFRQDLYYRLAVFPIVMPPLRERLEDIGLLSAHFLSQLSAENGMVQKFLSNSALTLLHKLEWEGNVRELQHAMERAFILSGNEAALGPEHFQGLCRGIN